MIAKQTGHIPETPNTHPVVVVTGPTASGKSALAEQIASAFSGEIINADSMQVYRQLDIGTAKPDSESMLRIPHHLFDIVNPDEEFTASDYCRVGRETVLDIYSRGHLPVVVGGTGLYIRALISGLADVPGADLSTRKVYGEMARLHGNDYLLECLRRVDPVSASRIHPNNRVRLIRALEVFDSSGRALSELQSEHGFVASWCPSVKIAIDVERAELYERINNRVDQMVSRGLVQEVATLLERGYSPGLKSLSSIGYKEICSYLAGNQSLNTAVEQIKTNSRRYAKRQLTWFKKDHELKWFKSPVHVSEVLEYIGITIK